MKKETKNILGLFIITITISVLVYNIYGHINTFSDVITYCADNYYDEGILLENNTFKCCELNQVGSYKREEGTLTYFMMGSSGRINERVCTSFNITDI